MNIDVLDGMRHMLLKRDVCWLIQSCPDGGDISDLCNPFFLDLIDELTPKPTVKPRKCVCCGGLTGNPELCDRCALEGYEAQRLDLG